MNIHSFYCYIVILLLMVIWVTLIFGYCEYSCYKHSCTCLLVDVITYRSGALNSRIESLGYM